MLNLEFALNYENLADKMIDAIQSKWTSPFNSPTVIFPDRNLEQWFRLRWITRKKVLANLRTRTLDEFLFDILVGDDKTLKRLPVEFLRNAMIAWLTTDFGGKPGYQTLQSDRVTHYLENDKDGVIDENRLFDFATMMSGLFLEYETSRPGNINPKHPEGLLDCWKSEEFKPFFQAGDEEKWQYKLYSAMFFGTNEKQSLLDRMSDVKGVKYRTIAQLYAQRRVSNQGTQFCADDTPVFLFWNAGMGQTYRVILDDFAHTHDVYAFVQNPCMEFWEDVTCFPEKMRRRWNQSNCPDELHTNFLFEEKEPETEKENTLLKKWGRAGRDNIRLWCLASRYSFEFAEESMNYTKAASLLKQAQCMVSHRTDTFRNGYAASESAGKYFERDASLSVTGAPSRIREIEALHTRICKLLQQGVRLNDIIVMAPDIAAYRSAIYQIFDQTDPDNKKQLRIPFTIVGTESIDSMTASALKTLCAIHAKGTLTRPAFFELVRNPVVQAVRGIRPEFVESWENWVDAMHIYRDRTNREEDWMDGVWRMIAARFANCTISNGDISYDPFSDLNSGDATSLCAFANCIKDLDTWIEMKSTNKTVDQGMLERVMEVMRSWLAIPVVPKGMGCENIVYQNIAESSTLLEAMFQTGLDSLSWECVYQTLQSASQAKLPGGKLFAHGITFMHFQAARIVPVKYLFFIGADEMKFPGSSEAHSLDLRLNAKWPGDTQPADRNRYGFLCQLMSTVEQFHISYVNKDLQKDKEFYPSSPIHDIRDMLHNAINQQLGESKQLDDVWPVEEIPLDEKRPWSDLFTPRALRNKAAFLKMINSDDTSDGNNIEAPNDNASNRPHMERISLYQIQQFLRDPFQFYISQILLEEEEDSTDVTFEPIALNRLENSQALKTCVQKTLENKEQRKETEKDAFFAEYQEHGYFPDGIFGEITKDNLWNKAQGIVQQMTDELNIDISEKGFDDSEPVEIKQTDGKFWTLQGKREWHSTKESNKISIYRISEKEKKEPKDYIPHYVTALSLLAEIQEDIDTPRTITMQNIWTSNYHETTIEMTPHEARDILQNIYEKINTEHRCIPFEWLKKIDDYNTFAKFEDELKKDNGPWQYFDKKDLFELPKDIGYHEDIFPDEWNEAANAQKELLAKLFQATENQQASKQKKEK